MGDGGDSDNDEWCGRSTSVYRRWWWYENKERLVMYVLSSDVTELLFGRGAALWACCP